MNWPLVRRSRYESMRWACECAVRSCDYYRELAGDKTMECARLRGAINGLADEASNIQTVANLRASFNDAAKGWDKP